jgi:hypothetical protein
VAAPDERIPDGRRCGCGDDLNRTIEDAFRQFVIGRLPADLLEDLAVTGRRR